MASLYDLNTGALEQEYYDVMKQLYRRPLSDQYGITQDLDDLTKIVSILRERGKQVRMPNWDFDIADFTPDEA